MAKSNTAGTTSHAIGASSPRVPVEARPHWGEALPGDENDGGWGIAGSSSVLMRSEESATTRAARREDDEEMASQAHLQAIALPAEQVRAIAARKTTPPRFAPEVDVGPILLRTMLAFPTLAVFVTAVGAVVAAIGSLWTLVHSMLALQFAEAAIVLPSLDTSGRILLAAAGYFALLVTLRALTLSLYASGWKRVRTLWTMLVMLPAAWLFVAGAGLVSGAGPLGAIPADLWRGTVLFLLLQVIALAVVTTQPSSRSLVGAKALLWGYPHHGSGGWSRPTADLPSMTAPLPVVRFGPAQDSQFPDDEDRDEDRPEFRISGITMLPRETLPVEGAPEPASPAVPARTSV